MCLNEQQWKTLAAAVDRIVPPDEYPGGWNAGVGEYLRRQFAGDLQPQLPVYREGLDGLDREAQAAYRAGFAALPSDSQDALLSEMETTPFFTLLVQHAMEGFYADPGNGGNREGVAWKMIGFEVRG